MGRGGWRKEGGGWREELRIEGRDRRGRQKKTEKSE